MSFAGMSYPAIVLATVVGWLAGAAWYRVLAVHWMVARGLSLEKVKVRQAKRRRRRAFGPLVIALLAGLVMAWILAGAIGHLGPGQVTLRNGIISGAFMWLGFVATSMAVNYAFIRRTPMLYAIDAGHWLVVLVLQGAVIGAMGV
jgi:hypothetical protein